MNTQHSILFAAPVLAAAACLAGCHGDRSDKPPRQFLPDMDDSPKFKPQTKAEFFADGRSMRLPVPGTVAFSRQNMDRDVLITKPEWAYPFIAQRSNLLKSSWEFYEGAVPARLDDGSIRYDSTGKVFAKVVDRIPLDLTPELIARGQERFNIYCAACHGYEGDGKGMVGDPNRPTGWVGGARNLLETQYQDPTNLKGKDGYLFYVARQGFYDATKTQKMPGYAHALDAVDAWAVVAWLRVLQESKNGTPADIPADKVQAMNTQRAELQAAKAKAAEEARKIEEAKKGAQNPGGTP